MVFTDSTCSRAPPAFMGDAPCDPLAPEPVDEVPLVVPPVDPAAEPPAVEPLVEPPAVEPEPPALELPPIELAPSMRPVTSTCSPT